MKLSIAEAAAKVREIPDGNHDDCVRHFLTIAPDATKADLRELIEFMEQQDRRDDELHGMIVYILRRWSLGRENTVIDDMLAEAAANGDKDAAFLVAEMAGETTSVRGALLMAAAAAHPVYGRHDSVKEDLTQNAEELTIDQMISRYRELYPDAAAKVQESVEFGTYVEPTGVVLVEKSA